MHLGKAALALGLILSDVALATNKPVFAYCKADKCLKSLQTNGSQGKKDCSSYLEKTATKPAV
jgi:hypothetical protein